MTADRWRELAEGEAVEAPLSAEEQAFLHAFAGDDDVQQERALFDGIEAMGATEPVRADDQERAAATLEAFRARRSAGGTRWAAAGIVGVLAIAATATLWIFARPDGTDLEPSTVAQAQVAEGTFMLADNELVGGDVVPGGEWVRARARSCVDVESGRACFDRGSELRILDGVVELRSGLMEVEQGSVSMMRDEGIQELEPGRYPSAAAEPEPIATRAAKPNAIPVEAPAPETTGGTTPRKAKKQRPASGDAGDMLAKARQLANRGKLGPAVSAYTALRRAHPGSAEARAANISIGQLQLRRGKARDAVKAFERYLKHGGSLAEEARWGRVRALHRMGKKRARDAAIDKLLKAHPHSVYATKAKALRGS